MKTTVRPPPRRARPRSRKANLWLSSATQVNIHAAKTHLSRLLSRVESGESITIARDGHAIAVISPPPAKGRPAVSMDDPLLRVDEYAFAGPVAQLTNEEMDRIVYGV